MSSYLNRRRITRRGSRNYELARDPNPMVRAVFRNYPTNLRLRAYLNRASARSGRNRVSGRRKKFRSSMQFQNVKKDELKWFDRELSSANAFGEKGTVILDSLNNMAEGFGRSQVVGRLTTIKSVQLSLSVVSLPAALDIVGGVDDIAHDFFVRVYLILDKQHNSAAAPPAVNQVFQANAVTMDTDIDSFLNLSNSDRFEVIGVVSTYINRNISALPAAAAPPPPAQFRVGSNETPLPKFYKKVNIPISFEGGGNGALTELRSKNLFLIAFASDTGVGAPGTLEPRLKGFTRIRFSDK